MSVIVGREGSVSLTYGNVGQFTIQRAVNQWQLQYRADVTAVALARSAYEDPGQLALQDAGSHFLLKQQFLGPAQATLLVHFFVDDEEGPLQNTAFWYWLPDGVWDATLYLRSPDQPGAESYITARGVLTSFDIADHVRQAPMVTVSLNLIDLRLFL